MDEALQATTLVDALGRLRATPWIGELFWYAYRDPSEDPSTIEHFFGLRRADGTAKPAYYDLFRLLRDSR